MSSRSRFATLTVSVVALTVFAGAATFVLYSGGAYRDDLLLMLHPSPEYAYELGNKHFDAADEHKYNIDRAKHFFEIAHSMDPKFPYVNHQLARVEFLRSHFDVALSYINTELETNPKPSPSSFYIRGLIEGYMGLFDESAKDYRRYLESDPTNWAAANDLAWVLLKAHRYQDARVALEKILPLWPENAWLLNSHAVALYELGELNEAERSAQKAVSAVMRVTPNEWSVAYPGNDPLIAKQGVDSFQNSVVQNMHMISLARMKEKNSVR